MKTMILFIFVVSVSSVANGSPDEEELKEALKEAECSHRVQESCGNLKLEVKVCLLDKRVAHMEAALEKIFGGQTAKLVLILPKFRRKIGLDSYLVEKEKAEKCVATTYDSCM